MASVFVQYLADFPLGFMGRPAGPPMVLQSRKNLCDSLRMFSPQGHALHSWCLATPPPSPMPKPKFYSYVYYTPSVWHFFFKWKLCHCNGSIKLFLNYRRVLIRAYCICLRDKLCHSSGDTVPLRHSTIAVVWNINIGPAHVFLPQEVLHLCKI